MLYLIALYTIAGLLLVRPATREHPTAGPLLTLTILLSAIAALAARHGK